MNRKLGSAALAGALVLAGSAAFAQTPWIHVRVEEAKQASKVSVNLPLSVVEAALALAPEKIASNGRFHLHDEHLSIADVRKLWNELSKVPDGDLVTVEERDEKVSISRRGSQVLIRVEKPGDNEEVNVDVPVALVDALFSGTGEELNLQGAVKELQKLRGDVVRVRDEDSTVRIWIDDRS